MASNLSHGMKRVLAGILSLLVVAGSIGLPANVGGGLFAKNVIVASAVERSDLETLYGQVNTWLAEEYTANYTNNEALSNDHNSEWNELDSKKDDAYRHLYNWEGNLETVYSELLSAYNAARNVLGYAPYGSGSSGEEITLTGSGTEAEPYELSSYADLVEFLKAGSTDAVYAVLNADIEVTASGSGEQQEPQEPQHNEVEREVMVKGSKVLDLNGKTLTMDYTRSEGDGYHVEKRTVSLNIRDDAALTIQDSSEEKTGVVKTEADMELVICQNGTFTLESGQLSAKRIEGEWISAGTALYSASGKVNIKGGSIEGRIAAEGQSMLTIEDGTFVAKQGEGERIGYVNVLQCLGGTTTITGGTFDGTVYVATDYATLTVTGGKIKKTDEVTVDAISAYLPEETSDNYSVFEDNGYIVVLEKIPYLTATWNESTQKVVYTEATASTYTEVASDTTAWSNGTYVVTGNTTISGRITVTGTVNLILCDGATLTASKGINVTEGNTFNIYAQSAGTGALTATGADYNAGIGGNGSESGNGENCGTVNIFGGTVNATGGQGGAGIGGGLGFNTGGNGGNVTIYGGIVTATGEFYAVGIGGGAGSASIGGNGGTVTINGGIVTATGGETAAGIGGGFGSTTGGNGATVTINGGQVTATGGYVEGIGGGYGGNPGNNGLLILGANLVLQNKSGDIWTNVEKINNDYARTQYMRTAKTLAVGQFIAVGDRVYTGALVNGWLAANPHVFPAGTSTVDSVTYDGTSKHYMFTIKDENGNIQSSSSSSDSSTIGDAYNYGALIASDTERTPAPNGFWITGGAGTVDSPYVLSLDPPTEETTTPTVTTAPTALNLTYIEDNPQPLVEDGVASDGATMQYALGDNATTAPTTGWDTSIPSQTDAGTYYVWYKAVNGSVESEAVCVEVTIGQANIESDNIQILTIGSSNYTGAAQYLITGTHITGGGGTLYAAVCDTKVAPADSSDAWVEIYDGSSLMAPKLTRTNAGTYYVYYKVVGDNNHNNVDVTFKESVTINKVDIDTSDISLALNSGWTYDGNAQNLITNANIPENVGTLYAAVSDTDSAPSDDSAWVAVTNSTSLSNSALQRTNAGTYHVYYKVVGDNNHNNVEPTLVSGSVTIDKAAPTRADFTCSLPNSPVYDGNQKAATVTANDDSLTGRFTVEYSAQYSEEWATTAPTAVGTYDVRIVVSETANYNEAIISIGSFEITKATPTITLATDSTYDGSAKPLISSITYAGGTRLYLCVKDANDTSMTWTRYNPNTMSLTDNSFKRTDAGTYYVYYYNDKIEPSTTTEGTLVGSVTIANGTITGVSATGYSMPYDGQAHGITLTGVPSGATVKYCSTENGTYTTNPITYTNATDGAQTVYYKVEKANYNTVSGSATVNISKAALTVTANPKTITYGEAPTNDGVVYSGFVNNETSDVLSGTLGYTYTYSQYGDVGNTYTITPSGLTSDNYDITFATGTLTVEKKEIGITWGNTSFTYDGGSHIPTASATGTVNGDVIEITVDGSQTAAGTNYTATASALTGTKAGNYTLPSANTTNFTISNASLEGYSVQDYTGTYDGGAHGITVSASGATITYKKEDDADYSATNPQFINAGTYTVYYKISKANYNDVTGSATVQINPKSVTITGLSASDKVYDGTTSATPTGTATVSGKVGTDDVSVSAGTAAFADANVGTGKTVTFTGYTLSGAKANNYTLSAQPSATANITQAALTVTAKPKTITYGDAPANDGVEYSGFVTGDDASKLVGTLDYDYSYTQYENIGTYSITPKGLTSGNYNISFVADTLTVQAKTIGINWTNTTFTYNGESHIPTASATGTVNDDGIGITVIGGQTNASDTAYTATASALTGAKAGNYALPTANTQTFTISKANPTAVAPTGLTAIYGQTLADVTLTNPTGNTAGSWAWADTTTTSVGDYGTRTFAANFTPTDATNYNNATNVQVTVTVGKAVPTYEAPVLQGTRLTHYSSDLLLIKTPGSLTEGQGTMYYAVTENAAAPDADAVDTWKTDISDIKATKAGTYYVWYKITGADNYELAPTQLGSVTVSQYRAPSYYSQTWTLTMDSYEYDGTAHTPTINGTPQTYSNTQVRYTYFNTDTNEELDGAPSAVGNYKVEVYADGGSSYYSRTQEAEYSITAIDLSDAHIEITSDPFWADGTKKTVAYTVKLGDKTLVKGTDYTVSGDSATAAGDYTLTVTGKGIYKGTATASWSIGKLYNITVTNGTVNGKTSGKFTPNTVLAVKSNAPASGKKFGFWRRNGATVSYNTTYTFPLTSDVELEAVYLDADDEFDTTGNCVKDSVTIDKENSKITFSFMNTVPNGCSIVKAGIVATSDIQQANALAIGNAMYTKECTSTKHNFKYNWTKSAVTDGQAWYVKGYLIYKDASGEEHTVYSNMEKATLNGSETIWEDKVVGTALNYGTSVNKADKKITFSTFLNVPADCTITKAGLVATNVKADSKNLTTANAKFVKGEASTKHSVLYNWTKKNVGANETWYVRPYLVYIDALGMEQTVYGDVTSATLNG